MIERIFNKPKTYTTTKDGLYSQYNQWRKDLDHQWFVRFLRHRFPQNTQKINFFGPLQNPFFIRNKFEGKKVFYTAEDVEHKYTRLWLLFGDYCLDYVDLAMGFGNLDSHKYLRFPNWISTVFEPEFTEDDIIKTINKINNEHYLKAEDCVLINKHDPRGTREMIYNDVKEILDVKLAGKWRNNTRDLWDKFNNDKYAYMKRFKFNICAENNNTESYVTEKLFDAFVCDCVPLYYGSNNDPEPGLINKKAVIFWNSDGKNKENRELVRLLKSDAKEYDDFIHQIKLEDACIEYVISRYRSLEEHFKRILE